MTQGSAYLTCKLVLFTESQLQLLHQDPTTHSDSLMIIVGDNLFVMSQIDDHALIHGRPGAVTSCGRHKGNLCTTSQLDLGLGDSISIWEIMKPSGK